MRGCPLPRALRVAVCVLACAVLVLPSLRRLEAGRCSGRSSSLALVVGVRIAEPSVLGAERPASGSASPMPVTSRPTSSSVRGVRRSSAPARCSSSCAARSSSGSSTARSSSLCALRRRPGLRRLSAAGRPSDLERLPARDLAGAASPTLVHCVVNGAAADRGRLSSPRGVSPRRCCVGSLRTSLPGYFGYSDLRPADRRAVGGVDIGVLGPAGADAAVRRALGVLAVRRRARGVRGHHPRAGPGGGDQGPLHPRSQRAGRARIGDDRAASSGCARTGSTRCATPGCCTTSASSASRPAVLQKTGRLTDEEFAAIQLHPVRGREISATSSSSTRRSRGSPPPRAHRRPRLPDGPDRDRRSPSSPASSPSPTRSTR